ncbi:hypothetical protein DM450_17880 [Sphingomonas sp. IC081]|nr:hypothetical protein DM450_17880 [Sphingomonas sp. IC081]
MRKSELSRSGLLDDAGFIDGAFVARQGSALEVLDPSEESVAARITGLSLGQLEQAIEIADWGIRVHPLIRFALDEKRLSGVIQVHLGEVIYGLTVSEVVGSDLPNYVVGRLVDDRTGWREYAVVAPDKADGRRAHPLS